MRNVAGGGAGLRIFVCKIQRAKPTHDAVLIFRSRQGERASGDELDDLVAQGQESVGRGGIGEARRSVEYLRYRVEFMHV